MTKEIFDKLVEEIRMESLDTLIRKMPGITRQRTSCTILRQAVRSWAARQPRPHGSRRKSSGR